MRLTVGLRLLEDDFPALDQIETVGRFAGAKNDLARLEVCCYRAFGENPEMSFAHPGEEWMGGEARHQAFVFADRRRLDSEVGFRLHDRTSLNRREALSLIWEKPFLFCAGDSVRWTSGHFAIAPRGTRIRLPGETDAEGL